jgi:hypothetical protein
MDEQAEERHERMAAERRFLYADVEELLSYGFLSHSARLNDVRISFRSFSPSDTFMLKHRVGVGSLDAEWKLWAVSTSIWMVEGQNLLEVPNSPVLMHRYLKRVSKHVIDILFSIVLGLFNRVSTALARTEPYCYEEYSRSAWRLSGRQVPNHDAYTGIPGSSRIGMNSIQRMWLAFNLAEDDRQAFLQRWQAAKLTASATSPKGIKKLNQSDERIHKRETERRRKSIARMVETILYGDQAATDLGGMTVLVRGEAVEVHRVREPESPNELVDEMRRWVEGDQDWHDLVVDTYKDRIREHYGQDEKEREGAVEEAMQPGVTGGTRLVGYTLEQLQELGYASPQPSAKKRVFDGHASSSVFQKYIKQDATAGKLGVQGQSLQVIDPSGDGSERVSLDEQVSRRNPGLSTEPIESPSVGSPPRDREPGPRGDQ